MTQQPNEQQDAQLVEKKIVDADAIRPAGSSTECFYCQNKLGTEHKYECVLRKKTVRLRVTIEYETELPEHWDDDMSSLTSFEIVKEPHGRTDGVV